MKKFEHHLFWPGLASLGVYLANNATGYNSVNSPFSALFSMLMTLWGIHFFVNWKRHEKSLNLLWNDYANQDNKITHPRKEFKGTLIISQITDKEDHQFTT